MWNFLRNLRLEGLSFWIGFLAGSLFWFVLGGARLLLRGLRERLQIQTQARRSVALHSDELRLNNDTLVRAQSWHIGAALFSLDEIIIEPRFLAPPVPPASQPMTTSTDITDWAVPYMPDWPEMASHFGAPTLSLSESMLGGSHLAIISQPGAGKTVALAYLAIQLIQNAAAVKGLEGFIPILLHAGDVILPLTESEDVLTPIFQAISSFAEPGTIKRLPKFLPSLFENGRALILLDGIDELPPSHVDLYVQYLSAVLGAYPKVRIVLSASPAYLDGLLRLDFFPLALASWSWTQRQAFIQRWSNVWTKTIAVSDPDQIQFPDPLLLHGWLTNEPIPHTPLELTLKVWAAFAGDSLGAKPHHAIEAHLRRLTCSLPDRSQSALEQMALQMVRYMQPIILRSDANAWLAGSLAAPTTPSGNHAEENENIAVGNLSEKGRTKAPGALSGLLENGIVIEYPNNRVSIRHPVIAGYLAGEALHRFGEGAQLTLQPDWIGKSQALKRLSARNPQIDFIDGLLEKDKTEILLNSLFTSSRWLNEAPEGAHWAANVMRQLAACLQKEHLPLSLKGRALSALVLSGNQSVQVLLHQMLESPQNDLRQLGALGYGMLRDTRSSSQISNLLMDPSPNVRNAAVLALVAIRDKASLETVADELLHGDEALRRAAAEALANDPDEGHPTLQEGSTLDEPLIRRSVVFGLARIKQAWAIDILEKLRAEDTQWVVQDAATQALAALEQVDPHIPRPLPELTQSPWLVSFAADHNMGVSPGKAAIDLMHRTIKEGDEEQILSAIYYLGMKGNESSILPLYQVYFTSKGEMREIALNALWYLAAAGVAMPPPIQFGMV